MYTAVKNIRKPKIIRTVSESQRKYPFRTMAVGSVFCIPGRKKNTLSAYASTVSRETGFKFTTQLTYMAQRKDGVWVPCSEDTKDAQLGIGVWRDK